MASHHLDGQDYYFKGFFGEEEFKPSLHPPFGILRDLFSRTTAGTSIGIIGLWKAFDGEIQNQIIKAVILNFWLAILRKKLVVKINQNYIDADNVYNLCCEHWPTYKGTKTGESINPRQFIECYLEKVPSQKFVEIIDKLGEVELILGKHSEFNGRISFFRKSNMLIDTKLRGNPNHNGYAGVFICENKEGNGILKRLENPRHDEWSVKNWKNPNGMAALKCLEEFVLKSYEEFFSIQKTESITIPKLNEFLQLGGAKGKAKKIGFSKKVKQTIGDHDNTTAGGGGEKFIRSLRSLARRNLNGQIEYMVSFIGIKPKPNAMFEITVGSDSDKAGEDSKIPILFFDGLPQVIKSNSFQYSIKEGGNSFFIVLDDEEKHSLKFKLI